GILPALLRRMAPTWLAQMPWLVGDDEVTLRQSFEHVKPERMLREFAGLIEALPANVTLLLVLEDLHWSDPSTVDLLSFLAQRAEPARVLVIGTFRSEAVGRDHGLMTAVRTLSIHRCCASVVLQDLSAEDVRHYLDARFPGNEFPPALARRIHQHTDGNPLFVIGVVDHLRSRGHIVETAPGWVLRMPVQQTDLGMPHDVQQLVENDLGELSPADRSVL